MLGTRHIVHRQFHDKVRDLAAEYRQAEQKTRGDGEQYACDIKRKDHQSAVIRKEHRREHRIHRQPRAAGHQRHQEDGHQTVTGTLQRARGHDGRHGAAESHDHGNKGFSRQTDLLHKAVHDKGRTGHIAGILQHRKHEEHDADDGNEGHDGLYAYARAVHQNGAEPYRKRSEISQHPQRAGHQSIGHDIKEGDQ
ncbi:MAG: hypothetical protein BWY83_02808 [bacterium ADurb.Bin478]|nr:MAG: hypothetical protein BWY83_02808 [bacterium ADurb.Bin478]